MTDTFPVTDSNLEQLALKRRAVEVYIFVRQLILLTIMVTAGYLLIDSPEELMLLRPQFTLGAIAFFIMGISAATVTRWGDSVVYLWIQLMLDTIFVSLLVATETTPQSPFFVLYTINILGAVRLLSFRGVMVVAIVDTSAFIFVSALGVMGFLNWEALPPLLVYWNTITRIFGLLLVGVLCVTLARQQTVTQRLLTQEVRKRTRIVKVHEDLLNQLPVGLFGKLGDAWVAQNEFAEGWVVRIPTLLEVLQSNQGNRHFELQFLLNEEDQVLLEFRSLDLQNGGAVFLFQDVTEIREIEKQAIRDDRLAAVGRLAASLAHEIRNPLGALSGAIQLLSPDKEHRVHKIILREIKRINDLVHNFLQSSRPPELLRTFQNVHGLMAQLEELFQNDPRFIQLNCSVQLCSQDVELYVDMDQMYQVFVNLALNAAHATAAGGEIEISDQIKGREWLCLVRDTGVGIAPENVDKIFDPFFTLRSGGTGLGLANVERIIRAHRGRIWVESQIGVGTTFYCALPLARGEYG